MPKLHNAHQQPCLHPHSWFWNLCSYRKKKYATKSLSPSLQTDPSGDQIPENERHRLTLPMKLICKATRFLGDIRELPVTEIHLCNRYTSTRYPSPSFTPPHPSRTTFLPRIPSPTSSETAWLHTPAVKAFFSWNLLEGTHTHLLGVKSPQSAPPCCCLSMTLITLLINFLSPSKKKNVPQCPLEPQTCVWLFSS